MIDLYGSGSPNVLKVAIMLEELGLPYRMIYVPPHIGANYDPAFLALNPLAKVPVIVDHDGAGAEQPIYESGAILIYLAETYQSPLLPSSGPGRWEVLKWLMVQIALAGPMLGQVNHFQLMPSEQNGYGLRRFRDQAARVYRNVDDRLVSLPWLGGESYSIADIAMYPWTGYLERHGFKTTEFPSLSTWRDLIDERPAVKRAVKMIQTTIAADPRSQQPPTEEDTDRFFARTQPGPAVDLPSYYALGPMVSAKA
ncbi:MAG TPA: glutathione S-transferase N-terminal domain-containing protein [Novosphingobium sp.]|nr:glutathione S-transferase N-terminal domain-containing protein [Novosphingobium sp.]